jgi:tetratricopeptide (TPR) repeat protein
VALLLHQYASALRARNDASAEPALRRALAIQEKSVKPDYHLTAGTLNTLGNLLEGQRQFDEAEKLERLALQMAEKKFGPESAGLAMTCTNLADVLWNKKDLPGAEELYRRAVMIDSSLYGPEKTGNGRGHRKSGNASEGMVVRPLPRIRCSGRRLPFIYEKTLGGESDLAKFVRDSLAPYRR